jgi:hypothetical protein
MNWTHVISLAAPLVALTLAMLKATWKLSDVSTKVDLILTNHLPHLTEDIKELRSDVMNLHEKL